MERRKTFLWRERMEIISLRLIGSYTECFHFGSQSEGTTTPGLQSDIDLLISNTNAKIMRAWQDWEAGKGNLLMLHNENTSPQQYLLQVIQQYTPEPDSRLHDYFYVRTDSMEVILSAEQFKNNIEPMHRAHVGIQAYVNGPCVIVVKEWDVVYAFPVLNHCPEIQHWINRCRGRHWPPAQLLEDARVAPCFLVAAGHSESDFKHEEWRLSPNLIERNLMFSFNTTQLKCYVILKLIKRSLLYDNVGDFVTSFYCKTIMFYTIERTNPFKWFEHNIMFVLSLCLRTLRAFLRLGRLPHYIIEGVNLFDGKVSQAQQRRLIVYIDNMVRNNLQQIFCIVLDNFGSRLQARGSLRNGNDGELKRKCLHNSISLLLRFECMNTVCHRLSNIINQIHNSDTTFEQDIKNTLHSAVQISTNVRLKSVALEFIKHLYGLVQSIQSSDCLRLRNVVKREIIMRFKYSLNTDVASSRLKLASILYCCGHVHAAVRVLEDVQRRYHNRVNVDIEM
ncbi:hypothetical protein DPMN_171628 [Dreissena polymorpha]|uniref:Mab-21-like HhH/H2TH-like domain-containing protein n=2 Tax=Dreissena polymorpha TaxID=45954 RepID=A0A9D4IFR8_DREPO|nr:hypothetical protein DPMN_171628 [Dreissena polymorpha]